MEMFLAFILWAIVVLALIRTGKDRQLVRGHHPHHLSHHPQWVPPLKDIDPVCGETVTTERARTAVHAGAVYYFCSRECREVFEVAPKLYLENQHAPVMKMQNSIGEA